MFWSFYYWEQPVFLICHLIGCIVIVLFSVKKRKYIRWFFASWFWYFLISLLFANIEMWLHPDAPMEFQPIVNATVAIMYGWEPALITLSIAFILRKILDKMGAHKQKPSQPKDLPEGK